MGFSLGGALGGGALGFVGGSLIPGLNPITAGAVGGLLGGLSGYGGTQQQTATSTQMNQMPAYLQPYASQIAQQAQANYLTGGPQYYPGQTISPFSSDTMTALNMLRQQATQPGPLLGNAQTQLNQTLTGQGYTQPEFLNAFKAAYNRITPQANSLFATAGRSGSGLHEAATTEALGNAYASLYNDERARQIQAAALAPGLDQAGYFGANQLLGTGGIQQQQAQDVLNADIARYMYGQNLPQQNLQTYLGNIGGLAGNYGTTITEQPIYRNQAAGMLGGALAGGALGSMIPGVGPWGGIGGALLGGLLGRS